METPELSISVGELIGVPRVTMRGCMDGWHDQAVRGVLEGFADQGASSIVLDLAGLDFTSIDGATGMINVLRNVGPGTCVHVIASGATRDVLHRAKLAPCVRLYASTDEIAEYVTRRSECFTSRWVEPGSEDEQLPLAA